MTEFVTAWFEFVNLVYGGVVRESCIYGGVVGESCICDVTEFVTEFVAAFVLASESPLTGSLTCCSRCDSAGCTCCGSAARFPISTTSEMACVCRCSFLQALVCADARFYRH